MASGYPGDHFATSIMAAQHYESATRRLVSKTVNSTDYEDLTLRFDLFFFSYHDGGQPSNDYFVVELSKDGGSSYPIELQRYTNTTGTPNRLAPQIINLNDYIDEPNLRIRFILYSEASNDGWTANAAMLDNIRLYGNFPLNTPFSWTVTETGANVELFMPDCETPLGNNATTEVCLKATEEQLEDEPFFK
ncbi:MAG: hypothetical protein H3C64_09430, partial [Candidatus Kuenenia stuttgartiensis]|nr:hypothetical protein [Candidatus Kuenenia stuttgartiensis]